MKRERDAFLMAFTTLDNYVSEKGSREKGSREKGGANKDSKSKAEATKGDLKSGVGKQSTTTFEK